MIRWRGPAVTLWTLRLAATSASAQMLTPPTPLGTLLYSPAERQDISANREEQTEPGTNQPAGNAKLGSSLSVHGVVARERRLGTVWLNETTLQEGQPLPLTGVPVLRKRDIVIDGKPVRVGETLDTETGARKDFVPAGTVQVREQNQ